MVDTTVPITAKELRCARGFVTAALAHLEQARHYLERDPVLGAKMTEQINVVDAGLFDLRQVVRETEAREAEAEAKAAAAKAKAAPTQA